MSTPNAAEAWDKRYAEAELVWSQEPNQYVVEYLSELPTGTMLDLGGGEGRNRGGVVAAVAHGVRTA